MSGNAARTIQLNILGDATSANKAMDSVGAKSEATSGRASKAFGGMLSSLNQGGMLGALGEGLDKVSQSFETLAEKGSSAGTKMLGIGAAAVGAGAMLTAAASKDTEAHNQLAQAISNTGQSMDDYQGQIDKTVKQQAKFGSVSSETQRALQTLTQATNDPAKALSMMSLAADLAAAKHESLNTAASQLAKTLGGSTKLLKEFGLGNVTTAAQSASAQKAVESQSAALLKAQGVEAAMTQHQLDNLATIGSAHKLSAAQIKTLQASWTSLNDAENSGDDGAAATAQTKFNDVLGTLTKTTPLTAAEQIKLRDSQQKVTDGGRAVTLAQTNLADAQKKAGLAAASHGATLDDLSAKLKGQASAAADSFGGRMRALRAEVENQVATIGQKYGPALTAAGAGMSVMGGLADIAKGPLKAMASGLGLISDATDVKKVAEAEEIPVQTAALGPILLIIAAIAILAFGIYELVTHWKVVWSTIKQLVGDAVDWVKAHWQLLAAILLGPIVLAVYEIKEHWGAITGFVTGVFDDIVAYLESVPGKVLTIATDIGKGLANGFLWGINAVIGGWDNLVGMLKIPGFSVGPVHFPGLDIGSGLQIPQVPYLAAGGIVNSPTLAMIGEKGPEAVVPLSGGVGGLLATLGLKDPRVMAGASGLVGPAGKAGKDGKATAPPSGLVGPGLVGPAGKDGNVGKAAVALGGLAGPQNLPHIGISLQTGPTLAQTSDKGPAAVMPLSHGELGGGQRSDVYLDGKKVGYAVARHVRDATIRTTGRSAPSVYTGLGVSA